MFLLVALIFLAGVLVFRRNVQRQASWKIIPEKEIKNEENSGETKNLPEKESRIVGGEKDIHGCLVAAGYSWCEAKNRCIRVWEEECDTRKILEDYLNRNISQLSPEKEVLGGRFFITRLEILPEGDRSIIEYEDGHISLAAKIDFEIENGEVRINSFEIIPKPIDDQNSKDGEMDNIKGCIDQCGNGICEEAVCAAIGCPCSESKETCPSDCK